MGLIRCPFVPTPLPQFVPYRQIVQPCTAYPAFSPDKPGQALVPLWSELYRRPIKRTKTFGHSSFFICDMSWL